MSVWLIVDAAEPDELIGTWSYDDAGTVDVTRLTGQEWVTSDGFPFIMIQGDYDAAYAFLSLEYWADDDQEEQINTQLATCRSLDSPIPASYTEWVTSSNS
jgi:hypothetical protein